jgi:diguanylate cyclase (GGDEF)-like protein
MDSLLGIRDKGAKSSPLAGTDTFRAQQAQTTLRRIARGEWWHWLTAALVVVLSGSALLLSSFPSFFRHSEHFYEMRPEQARWAVLCLLLLFNGWSLYRQWRFRKERKHLTVETDSSGFSPADTSTVDPVTGLHTRFFIEQQLGKEIARAKRQNTPLSLATIHLDDFAEAQKRYGLSAIDAALKELARRLKKACRGSDFAARLASDDFLLVLPECNVGEVQAVLNRLGAFEMVCSGRKVSIPYTTGWVDYQPGDMPSDMLKRAAQLLHLYENAAMESYSTTPAPH